MIVLASASPRRKALLEEAGIAFRAAPVEIDEDLRGGRPGADAAEIATALAVRKALARAALEPGDALVLAADTIVVAPEGDLLGKPRDEGAARRMIERLSGRRHRVVTGVALVASRSGSVRARAVESFVLFRDLAPGDVDAYIRSGLWRDKAGAYGVQDRPPALSGVEGPLVARVEGSLTNVVGLPVEAVKEMLGQG